MGDPRGFLKHEREVNSLRRPSERLGDWAEHDLPMHEEKKRTQGSRCMDCGVPFCQSGCPLGNLIPDFNDLVFRGQWKEAIRTLHATNNFPEFTGKICPAPCENACVLGIIEPPVTIKMMEKSIVEKAFEAGYIKPQKPVLSTGKKVAIVGGGPAGLACAQQLNRAGHTVTVYERSPKAGGLVQWGIPAYKLRKEIVQRRVGLLTEEGVNFVYDTHVGKDVTWKELQEGNDAVVVAIGAEKPRDLPVQGRDASGVHFAMEFLPQNISKIYNESAWNTQVEIKATGKDVVVIGGGDTGSDCIGTSLRQGARSVTNFELLSKPPGERGTENPWPQYARVYRVSSSMEENFETGGDTEYDILTKEFIKDENGQLKGVKTVQVEWEPSPTGGRPNMNEVPGTEKVWDAQLALLAMGFLGPVTESLVEELGVELDVRSNIKTDEHTKMSSVDGLFAAGDCRRGQSLVVWAIAEGREIASNVDTYLMGKQSLLPRVRLTPYKY